jgi:hypothetical protein
MKKLSAAIGVATFAFAPIVGADCGGHDAASSASATPPSQVASVPAAAASKAPASTASIAPAKAKTEKQVAGKKKDAVTDAKVAVASIK